MEKVEDKDPLDAKNKGIENDPLAVMVLLVLLSLKVLLHIYFTTVNKISYHKNIVN